MINIVNKADCCGCTACAQKCPKQCITMVEDNEGFLYPNVDTDNCIECGLCEKVCPVINQSEAREPIKVYAAKNKDEKIRGESSSGGIFTLLAEKIITQGGVVFGARFNAKWEVVHSYTETVDGLAAFRGSKYVQSQIGNTYKDALQFLKAGRDVLFSGTPCQIAGLKLFLGKDYDNLLTVDFICHGVPSPKVWRVYLQELIRPQGGDGKNMVSSSSLNDSPSIEGVSFRDKTNGWKKFGFVVWGKSPSKGDKNLVSLSGLSSTKRDPSLIEYYSDNIYMRGFLSNLYLRPTCYSCPSKSLKSGSDITLADYWGIQDILPNFDDNKGISLILINSDKGADLINESGAECIETSYDDAVKKNSAAISSVQIPSNRKEFFENIDSNMIKTLKKQVRRPFKTRLKTFIKKVLLKLHTKAIFL